MNTNSVVNVDITLPKPKPYTTKYNLILLENSKVTTQELIMLFESFYNSTPKSFTFIFDFSRDINNLVNFTPILDYIEEYNHPEWSYRVCNPLYLGNMTTPTTLSGRLDICSDLVYQFLGSYGTCMLENVWWDIKEQQQ